MENSNNDYPDIKTFFSIKFSPDKIEKIVKVEFVLDYNQYNEIIAVEIISLKFYAGENCLKLIKECISPIGEKIRYSYDEEADAFNINLSKDRSFDQAAVDGEVLLNKNGNIVELRAILDK